MSRPAKSWPRVYAQLIRTGEIFEIARGVCATAPHRLDPLGFDFGSGWIVWPEFKRSEGAHGANNEKAAA